jgi:hypothetical protein
MAFRFHTLHPAHTHSLTPARLSDIALTFICFLSQIAASLAGASPSSASTRYVIPPLSPKPAQYWDLTR